MKKLFYIASVLFLLGCNTYPETPEDVTTQYLTNIYEGECEKALKLCVGNARETTYGSIEAGCEPNDFKIHSTKCVIKDESATCLCELDISLLDSLTLPFYLELVDDQWKISSMNKGIRQFPETEELSNLAVANSLEEELESNYFSVILDHSELYLNNLKENKILVDEKNSYANFFNKYGTKQMNSLIENMESIDWKNKSEKENEDNLDFYEYNLHSGLYHTCTEYQNQRSLNNLQKDFVIEFAFDSWNNTPDHKKVAKIIKKMTNEEFNSKGIREICIVYIVDALKYDL